MPHQHGTGSMGKSEELEKDLSERMNRHQSGTADQGEKSGPG